MLIKDCFDRYLFTLVITLIFLLSWNKYIHAHWYQERWQSITNPRYLTLKTKSKGCLAILVRIQFLSWLENNIFARVLLKFKVNLLAHNQSYILRSSQLTQWINSSIFFPHVVSASFYARVPSTLFPHSFEESRGFVLLELC